MTWLIWIGKQYRPRSDYPWRNSPILVYIVCPYLSNLTLESLDSLQYIASSQGKQFSVQYQSGKKTMFFSFSTILFYEIYMNWTCVPIPTHFKYYLSFSCFHFKYLHFRCNLLVEPLDLRDFITSWTANFEWQFTPTLVFYWLAMTQWLFLLSRQTKPI